MKEKRLKLTLDQLGQKAFPDDTDPWTPIQERLAQYPAAVNVRQASTYHPEQRLRRQYVGIGIAVVLILAAVFILLSPGGEALAETLRHLFRPVSAEELPPVSSEALATPTFAPTFAVSLAAVQESKPESISTPVPLASFQATEPTFPAPPVPEAYSPPGLSACNADPYGYTCRIAQAEKTAGFDAKEFPADPDGFHFKTVASAKPGEIWLEYDVIGGGGYLYLNQGLGSDFPAFTGAAQQDAIETVQVGGHMGEYLVGDYAYGGVHPQTTWLSCCRFRLRWTDGERWYELDKQAALPQTDYMTRDVMIDMATELVDQPELVQGPRLDYLKSLEEAAQVAEFAVVAPTLLPEKFTFNFAKYNQDLSQLHLIYTPPDGLGTAEVLVIETPLDKVSLASGWNGEGLMGETVDINGNPGIYVSNDPYTHTLTWASGEIKVTLLVYASEIGYGGSFTKDQILEIGRSMK